MKLKRNWKSIARKTNKYAEELNQYYGLRESSVSDVVNNGTFIMYKNGTARYDLNELTYFIPQEWLEEK